MSWYTVDLHLLTVKLLFFMFYGSRFTFISYFAVFAKSYGFTTSEIGYLFTSQTGAFFCGSFFISYLIQRTHKEKGILYSSIIIISLSSMLLPLMAYYTHGMDLLPCHVIKGCSSKNVSIQRNLLNESVSISPNSVQKPHVSLYLTFVSLAIIRSFFQSIMGPMDLICMKFCQLYSKKSATYDRHRALGSVGAGILPCVTGMIIDIVRWKLISYFLPAFAISSLADIVVIICLWNIFNKTAKLEDEHCLANANANQVNVVNNTNMESENEHLILSFLKTFRKPEILLITLINFLLGSANSVWYGFLLLLMNDEMSSSSEIVFGLTLVSQCLIDLLLSRSSAKIIRYFKNPYHAMIISLLLYAAAFFGTAICKNSYIMPAIGMLPGAAFAIFFLPHQHEVVRLVEPKSVKMQISFQCGIYYFIGGGSSTILSGILFNSYGGKLSFIIMGIVLTVGFLLSVVCVLIIDWKDRDK